MLNKDVTHPHMRRRIENPRIVLLDCPLEYKKGESQTNAEITDENHWNRLLQIEEEQIKEMCEKIVAVKPDLVLTEKGVSGEWLEFIKRTQRVLFVSSFHNNMTVGRMYRLCFC